MAKVEQRIESFDGLDHIMCNDEEKLNSVLKKLNAEGWRADQIIVTEFVHQCGNIMAAQGFVLCSKVKE